MTHFWIFARWKPSFSSAIIASSVLRSIAAGLCTYDKLPPPGNEAVLHTVLIVREDDMSLYGFATQRELKIFRLLCTVNGIGAKTALNILSSLNIPSFCQAILSADIRSLKKINGVGPKSAERMVVELRDKMMLGALNNIPGLSLLLQHLLRLRLEEGGATCHPASSSCASSRHAARCPHNVWHRTATHQRPRRVS